MRRLLIALVIVLAFRLIPGWGEFYALHLYPAISCALSWVTAWIPFSLDEWSVLASIVFLFYLLFRSCWDWKRLRLPLEMLIVVFVWFNATWGINYSRDGFYKRMNVELAKVDSLEFRIFLNDYTDSLNALYTAEFLLSQDSVESEIKRLYEVLPKSYGLCRPHSWQHPKIVAFDALYSGVGVRGYMGPFFCGSQLNGNLLPVGYASVYAHELSHLLGITEEGEANYWSFRICKNSNYREIRYSGYFGIVTNVIRTARTILSPEEYKSWMHSLRPQVRHQLVYQQVYWHQLYNPTLSEMQDKLFDLYLKGNSISAGTKNYDQVVRMIISSL